MPWPALLHGSLVRHSTCAVHSGAVWRATHRNGNTFRQSPHKFQDQSTSHFAIVIGRSIGHDATGEFAHFDGVDHSPAIVFDRDAAIDIFRLFAAPISTSTQCGGHVFYEMHPVHKKPALAWSRNASAERMYPRRAS